MLQIFMNPATIHAPVVQKASFERKLHSLGESKATLWITPTLHRRRQQQQQDERDCPEIQRLHPPPAGVLLIHALTPGEPWCRISPKEQTDEREEQTARQAPLQSTLRNSVLSFVFCLPCFIYILFLRLFLCSCIFFFLFLLFLIFPSCLPLPSSANLLSCSLSFLHSFFCFPLLLFFLPLFYSLHSQLSALHNVFSPFSSLPFPLLPPFILFFTKRLPSTDSSLPLIFPPVMRG